MLNRRACTGEVKRRFKHTLRRQIVMIQTHPPSRRAPGARAAEHLAGWRATLQRSFADCEMSQRSAGSYYRNSGGFMPRLLAKRRSLLAMGMGIERQAIAAHAAEPPQQYTPEVQATWVQDQTATPAKWVRRSILHANVRLGRDKRGTCCRTAVARFGTHSATGWYLLGAYAAIVTRCNEISSKVAG